MKSKIYFSVMLVSLFLSGVAQAICVNNQTAFQLDYEIYNKNRCCTPKVKFHKGTLAANQKNCHAHSPKEGCDWKIYRKDLIVVYKVDLVSHQRELVCRKKVEGILNTVDVSFISGAPQSWWCLDKHDYQD